MAPLDPVTTWFFRGALAAAALVCLAGALALGARAIALVGSRSGSRGLAGLVAWWLKNGKTYTVAGGAVGALLFDHFVNGAPLNWPGIFEAVGAMTLRAAIAKNQTATEVAATAAKVTAVRVEQTLDAKERLQHGESPRRPDP